MNHFVYNDEIKSYDLHTIFISEIWVLEVLKIIILLQI